MLKMKDFIPQSLKPAGLFSPRTYENLSAAATAASEWLQSSGAKLVQIETVLVPNPRMAETDPTDVTRFTASSDASWVQFIRVWYSE